MDRVLDWKDAKSVAGRSAANPLSAVTAVDRWERQTDRRPVFQTMEMRNGAVTWVTLNVLVVSVIGRFSVTRHHTSVYNVLFVNLAVTNALTSILLWFANNLLTRSTFLCTI